MVSAVEVLLRNNPSVQVLRLPVSWRLPATAAPVVAEAFYPFGGFSSGTGPGERSLSLRTRGLGARALDECVELACSALAARLLQRGCEAASEVSPGAPVTASRIAIGTAHRDQARAVRKALAGAGAPEVVADTANRLQGREFDVTIVLHPLSGRRDATAFHLESGRLCVLTSRHRHACIVVARAGIPELLDAHPAVEPVHLNVPAKFPDGWAANQAIMAHLADHKVRAS